MDMDGNNIPKQLIESFKKRNVVLFIGSGLSMNAKLPSWSSLLRELKNDFIESTEEQEFYDQLDFLQKAQYLYGNFSKSKIISKICEIIRSKLRKTKIYDDITSLPVDYILTTNWDELIEDAFKKADIELNTIHKDENLFLVNEKTTLLKFHGTITDPTSMVFAEKDYYDLINSASVLNKFITTLFSTKDILFIGYSYSDLDLKLLVNYINNRMGEMKRRPYIFLPNPKDFDVKYYKTININPIPIEGKDKTSATFSFLKSLKNSVSTSSRNPVDRLNIIHRENRNVLSKVKAGFIIRNKSNLGPLATPSSTEFKKLFGKKEITNLEIKCAAAWKELLEKGASAKCIIRLANIEKDGAYKPNEEKERLTVLKENIRRFKDKIDIAFIDSQIVRNIDIYDNYVVLTSDKNKHKKKGYSSIKAYHDSKFIKNEIYDFDEYFNSIKKFNDELKEHHDSSISTHEFVILKIDEIINEFERDEDS